MRTTFWLTQFEDKTLGILPDSPARANKLKHELSKFAEVSVENIQNALRNHDKFPNSICRHSESIIQIQTVASIIMDLTEKSMTIATVHPVRIRLQRYTLNFIKKIQPFNSKKPVTTSNHSLGGGLLVNMKPDA